MRACNGAEQTRIPTITANPTTTDLRTRSDILFDITISKDFLLTIRSLKLVRKADDESVPVRHFYFRQRLRVHLIVLADEFVERQNVRGQSVDLVVGESLWLLPRHRPARKVEDGRGIGPEVGNGLSRLHVLDRAAADHRGIDPALTVYAVAHGALLRVDGRALGGRTAAGRQASAVRQDADVPGSDLCRIDRLSKIRRLGESNARTETERENKGGDQNITHKHV